MDPTAFDQEMTRDIYSKTDQDDSDSPRLFGAETEDETGEGGEGERESDRSTRSETTSMDEGTDQEDGDDRE